MEISRRSAACSCLHQDGNILHSLLMPNCQTSQVGYNSKNSSNAVHHCHHSLERTGLSQAGNVRVSPVPAASQPSHSERLQRDHEKFHALATSVTRAAGGQAPRDRLHSSLLMTEQQLRDIWQGHQYRQQLNQHHHSQHALHPHPHHHRHTHQRYHQQRPQHVDRREHSASPPGVSRPNSPPVIDRYPLVSTMEAAADATAAHPFPMEGFEQCRRRSGSTSSYSSTSSTGSVGRLTPGRDHTETESGYSSSSSSSSREGTGYSDGDPRHRSSPDSGLGAFDGNRLYRMLRGEKIETSSSPVMPTPVYHVDNSYKKFDTGQAVGNGPTKRRFDESTEQVAPMDLTCKKPRLGGVLSSPGHKPEATEPAMKAALPPLLYIPPQSPTHASAVTQCSRSNTPSHASLAPGSMLKSLLHGALSGAIADMTRATPDADAEQGCNTPPPFATGNTRVTIAKKTLLPISARISDWLVKTVQFCKTLPEFNNLSHNDKFTMVLHAWPRILLLFMAETNFQFAVTPVMAESVNEEGDKDLKSAAGGQRPLSETPTMSAVEKVQAFIRKCQSLNLDAQEYSLLKSATLFNTGKTI